MESPQRSPHQDVHGAWSRGPGCRCVCHIIIIIILCIQVMELFTDLECLMVSARSHDNGRIVSGGADKVVILTDVGTGQPIRKFRGHLGVSYCTFISVHVRIIPL